MNQMTEVQTADVNAPSILKESFVRLDDDSIGHVLSMEEQESSVIATILVAGGNARKIDINDGTVSVEQISQAQLEMLFPESQAHLTETERLALLDAEEYNGFGNGYKFKPATMKKLWDKGLAEPVTVAAGKTTREGFWLTLAGLHRARQEKRPQELTDGGAFNVYSGL